MRAACRQAFRIRLPPADLPDAPRDFGELRAAADDRVKISGSLARFMLPERSVVVDAVGESMRFARPRSSGPRGLLAAICIAPTAGCTAHIRAYERPLPPEVVDRLNASLGSAKHQKLILGKDARPIEATVMTVTPTEVSWVESQGNANEAKRTVPPDALQTISFQDHGRGVGDGALAGAIVSPLGGLLGGLAGAGLTPSSGCDYPATSCYDYGKTRGTLLGVLAGMCASVGLGAVIGGLIGHTTVIEFAPPPGRAGASRQGLEATLDPSSRAAHLYWRSVAQEH